VEEEKLIARAEKRFASQMLELAPEQIPVVVRLPGRTVALEVAWSERLGIWMSFQATERGYWNVFGTERPAAGKRCSIACEINLPHQGVHRRTAGVVGAWLHRPRVIAHRGKFGAGRATVSAAQFAQHFTGAWELFNDGGQSTQLALVGDLDTDHFPWQVADFVKQVHLVKRRRGGKFRHRSLWQADLSPSGGLPDWSDGGQAALAACNRGLISTALVKALSNQGMAVNDQPGGIVRARRGEGLFTLKIVTDNSQRSLAEALGDLYLKPEQSRLALITPAKPSDAAAARLQQLGIGWLEYALGPGGPRFSGIDRLLAPLRE
jgi:hypothetical protein